MDKLKAGIEKIKNDIQEWENPTDEERQQLLKAGFVVDDGYTGGNTYRIETDTPWKYNTVNLGRPRGQKYYTATINGQGFAYPDLATAIDRAKYISGKSPYNGSLKWNGRNWE